MVDVDSVIRAELDRLAPPAAAAPAWGDVVHRSRTRGRSRYAVAAAAALAVLAVAAPTLALSSGVRGLLGFGRPLPFLAKAHLVLTVPAGHGFELRLWGSPPALPTRCEFVVVARVGAHAGTGVGQCRIGRLRMLKQPLDVHVRGTGNANVPATIAGSVSPRLRATRVELRWATGSQRLAFRDGYFAGVPMGIPNPPRGALPYQVVVYGKDGSVVARRTIPASELRRRP